MRISGALASDTETRPPARAPEPLRDGTRGGRLRVGYVLAIAWVIVALALWAFEMMRIAAGRG
jgi:hypothetical protein